MKFIIVFVALFAIALADVEIVRQDLDVQPGSFSFGVETSDGSVHDAVGKLNNAGSDDEELAVHGSYSFVGQDGVTYAINYVADKNGFQPKGDHLPVGPEP